MEYGSDISPQNRDATKETTFTSLAQEPATTMLSHALPNLVGNSNFWFVNWIERSYYSRVASWNNSLKTESTSKAPPGCLDRIAIRKAENSTGRIWQAAKKFCQKKLNFCFS